MKSCSLILAIMLVFISFLPHSRAEYITQQFDPSLYKETTISKPINKIIIAKVERQQILNISDQKYAQEFAYFFYKFGFKRPPVSFLLFDDGNVATLNSDWQFNQPNTSLNQGVLFLLMVYDGAYDSTKFQPAIDQFKSTTLKTSISTLGLTSSNAIELRQFVVENVGENPVITFKDVEDSQVIRSQFSDIDFATKTLPDLQVSNIVVPAKADPSSLIKAQIAITNNSNFDYLFGTKDFIQFRFDKDSVFFVNNKWLNQRIPIQFKDGALRSKETKTFEVDLSVPVVPGSVKEKMNIEFGAKLLSSPDIALTINDNGQKILKIKPTELNFLYIRQDPLQTSKEVGRASVGTIYAYTDSQSSFYKILFNNGLSSGWVSSKYVEIIK